MSAAPPGWPTGLAPPGATVTWAQDAARWLLDVAPAHFRLDPVLTGQPIVLARRVVEHLSADLLAARQGWILEVSRWTALGLPVDAHHEVLVMLAQLGPQLGRVSDLMR